MPAAPPSLGDEAFRAGEVRRQQPSGSVQGGETVLTGVLEDRAALFGVIAQIEALGLDLLEVRHIV